MLNYYDTPKQTVSSSGIHQVVYWAKNGLPADKWRLRKTDPLLFVALSRIIFLLICKFKTNCIAYSQLLCIGYPLRRESINKLKKNPIFPIKSVCVRLQERLLAGMCKYRVWLGRKKVLKKVWTIKRAVCLRVSYQRIFAKYRLHNPPPTPPKKKKIIVS